jgi:hypothetical protein
MAFFLTAQLLAASLFLHGTEHLWISFRRSFRKIWSFENIGPDLRRGLPLPDRVIQTIFSVSSFRVIAILQIILAIFAIVDPQSWFFVGLAVTHLFMCIRFRGTFNGGSDMMVFVVLTGVLIGLLGKSEFTQKLGLIYICIHALYSYFKAGLAKIRHRDWRNGSAISAFLGRSLFSDIRRLSAWLQPRRTLSLIFCWLVLAFELGSAILIFAPRLAFVYFLAAMAFHLAIYASFGLNRFFLIWLSAWPAILYSLSLL